MTYHPSHRSRDRSVNKLDESGAKVVDVKVLPKRPMTTANPNQRQMTNTTYNVGMSSVEDPSQTDNLIKEDDGNEEEEYLYGHDDEGGKTQPMNTVSAG